MEEQDKLEQFTALKEALTEELAGVEVQIARIEQDYTILLPEYYKRKDALVHALFDEPPVEITMEDHGTESTSNSERLVTIIKANPGASKQDLRKLLPDLTEAALKQAIGYCSKNKIIENRGVSKAKPEWYVV